MKSVGEILKKARMEQRLSLEEVESKIKIRAKFLAALEADDYHKLPSAPYIRGFIKNYSEFLGLSPEKVLAIFRRQFDERKNLGLLPHGLTEPLEKEPFTLKAPSPVVFLFLLPPFLLFLYLYREYRLFVQPPSLAIQSPTEQAIIFGQTVEVTGKTDPSATLELNSQKITLKEDGSFTQKITLGQGLNTLEFVARNKLGKETKLKRTIKVNP